MNDLLIINKADQLVFSLFGAPHCLSFYQIGSSVGDPYIVIRMGYVDMFGIYR